MKSWILILLLFPCTLFATNIEGTYEISGHDPYENSNYSGTATIKADKNDVYQIVWSFNDGDRYQGTALMQGNKLSSVFFDTNPEKKNQIGIQIYTIKDNILDGNWVLLNQNLVGKEKLTKKK